MAKSPKVTEASRLQGVGAQPVSAVEWVPREKLHANDYNPNRVFKPELALLKLSILEDGWTQPIVARRDFEIVDGFHRWTISAEPEVHAMTDGLVPVAWLDSPDLAQQRMATIRHNRARGSHYVVPMAAIVRDLVDDGVPPEEVGRRLGMEREEVERLLDRGNMVERGSKPEFNKGWSPQ